MKIDEIRKELQDLSIDELKEKLDSWQRELFSLRLNSSTAHIKDYSQFSKIKKNIARTLTYIRQKNRSK